MPGTEAVAPVGRPGCRLLRRGEQRVRDALLRPEGAVGMPVKVEDEEAEVDVRVGAEMLDQVVLGADEADRGGEAEPRDERGVEKASDQ